MRSAGVLRPFMFVLLAHARFSITSGFLPRYRCGYCARLSGWQSTVEEWQVASRMNGSVSEDRFRSACLSLFIHIHTSCSGACATACLWSRCVRTHAASCPFGFPDRNRVFVRGLLPAPLIEGVVPREALHSLSFSFARTSRGCSESDLFRVALPPVAF
jgi:hypothetical protein